MDEIYMRAALDEAKKAYRLLEIPIGAVIVKEGKIVGRGHNLKETGKDATLHAEIIAIREACKNLGGWRLPGCTMYVTLEPCSMCAGALVSSRIENLVIGTRDPKTGACGSIINIVQMKNLNHQIDVKFGILQEECTNILRKFFAELRQKNK
jgi:tRNA(adenine34) deaminase